MVIRIIDQRGTAVGHRALGVARKGVQVIVAHSTGGGRKHTSRLSRPSLPPY